MKNDNGSLKKVCFYVCLHGSSFKKPPISEDIEIVITTLGEVASKQNNALVVIHCKRVNFHIIDAAYYVGGCIYCEEFEVSVNNLDVINYLQNKAVPVFWNLEDLAIYMERYYKLQQITTQASLLQFISELDSDSHSYGVSQLSGAIAVRLGCDKDTSLLIAKAALMHDIGKIAIPHSFLNSSRWYNEVEKKFVSFHVLYGYDLLRRISLLDCSEEFTELCKDVALYHHERCDGSGYPTGEYCETIPLSSKIVAVSDVYHALRSHRPYRSACDHELAISFLKANEKKFVPEIVKALEDIIKNGNFNLTT